MTLEEYIRAAAQQRGIDPDIAVRVAKSEGGLNDPTRQSDVRKNGVREPSYGPFQLLVGGGETGFPTGLGNDFVNKYGVHPSDPNAAYKGIDFALDTAARDGWGRWYGAKAIGLDKFAGIGGRPASAVASAAPASSPSQSSAPVFGAVPTPRPEMANSVVPAAVQQAAYPKAQGTPADIFGMLAMAQPQETQFSPVQTMGPSPEQSQGLLKLIQTLKGVAV